MEEHRGRPRETLDDVPIQAPESTPNLNNCSRSGPERSSRPVPEQLYGFPSPDPGMSPSASEKRPRKPAETLPRGPDPEQIYVYKAPSRPRTPPPPPARGVWYYFTVSCLSCTISCDSCSITSTSGVTLVMRDSAKRLYSASFAAI